MGREAGKEVKRRIRMCNNNHIPRKLKGIAENEGNQKNNLGDRHLEYLQLGGGSILGDDA